MDRTFSFSEDTLTPGETLATEGKQDDIDANLASINLSVGAFSAPSTLRPVAFDSYTSVAVTSVTGTNQQVIAAPGANKQIWVYGWILVGTATGTVLFEDGDGTALTGAMSLVEASGSAPTIGGNLLMPRFKVPTNKSLRLDVATATVNGQITYAIVSV